MRFGCRELPQDSKSWRGNAPAHGLVWSSFGGSHVPQGIMPVIAVTDGRLSIMRAGSRGEPLVDDGTRR